MTNTTGALNLLYAITHANKPELVLQPQNKNFVHFFFTGMDESPLITIRRIRVPDGLDALLEEIIRAVLKEQPADIHLFIANHLRTLIRMRNEGE